MKPIAIFIVVQTEEIIPRRHAIWRRRRFIKPDGGIQRPLIRIKTNRDPILKICIHACINTIHYATPV